MLFYGESRHRKRVSKGKWTMTGSGRIERGSVLCSQTTEWLFNLVGLIFFCARECRWKITGATMIDAFADTGPRREQRKGTRIFSMRYRLRNAATDLHQGNHDDTSYGKSLYTRVHVHGWNEGIWIYRFIGEPLYIPPSFSTGLAFS